jgi:hypothetical protein
VAQGSVPGGIVLGLSSGFASLCHGDDTLLVGPGGAPIGWPSCRDSLNRYRCCSDWYVGGMKTKTLQHHRKRGFSNIWDPHSRDLFPVFLLFTIDFIGHSILAHIWFFYGVFSEYNVLFDADPNLWLSAFANGWSVGTLFHPLLPYYFSIPIRVIATVASFFGSIGSNEAHFREALGLYVSPICAALKAVCLYLSFRILELTIIQAILASGFGVLSVTSIVFGTSPESYGVTGLGLALMALCSLLLYKRNDAFTKSVFLCSGLFATGITISNIIFFGWLSFALQLERRSFFVALKRSAIIASIVLIVTLSIHFALKEFRHVQENASVVSASGGFIKRHTNTQDSIISLMLFPELMSRTFIPTIPERIPNNLAIQNNDLIKFELIYDTTRTGKLTVGLWVISILIFGGGCIIAFHHGGAWRWIAFSSLMSVITFAILYSSVGYNKFLYSQAWQIPCMFLLGAWFPMLRSTRMHVVCAGILVLIGLGDYYIVHNINTWIVIETGQH